MKSLYRDLLWCTKKQGVSLGGSIPLINSGWAVAQPRLQLRCVHRHFDNRFKASAPFTDAIVRIGPNCRRNAVRAFPSQCQRFILNSVNEWRRYLHNWSEMIAGTSNILLVQPLSRWMSGFTRICQRIINKTNAYYRSWKSRVSLDVACYRYYIPVVLVSLGSVVTQ